MEEILSFEVTDSSLGTLDIEEMFNSQFTYDSLIDDVIHLPEEDEEQTIFAGNFLKTSLEEIDGSVQTSHGTDVVAVVKTDCGINLSDSMKGLEMSFNTTSGIVKDVEAEQQSNTMMHVKLLPTKLEEKDETVRSFMNEIEGLKKKVIDQEIIINKMNEQVSILKQEIKKCALETKVNSLQMRMLHKQNTDVKDESISAVFNEMGSSNGVQATRCIIKNGIDNTVLDDGITAADAMMSDRKIAPTVMQHEDVLLQQNVFQSEAKIDDKDDDLMDVSSREELSELNGSSFFDRESSHANTKVAEKILSGKFECLLCHKRFLTKGKLNTHQRFHTDGRPFPCCVCKQSFRERKNLVEHISRLHKRSLDGNTNLFVRKPGPEGFRCCFCLQLMKSREFYRTHIYRFHTDLLPRIH